MRHFPTAKTFQVGQARWRRSSLAETDASDPASAACYRRVEDFRVVPVVVTELKLRDVQRHIFLADLVERANDATFENAPEAFDRVGVDDPRDVFAGSVAHDLVLVQFLHVLVADPFVSDDEAHLVGHGVHNEARQHFGANGVDHTRNNVALARDGTHDRRLARAEPTTAGAAALVLVPILGFAADERLVDLDNPAELVEILFDERSADAMAHIPSRFVRAEAHVAMDLASADALLAGQHKMDDAKPLTKVDVRIFEDCSGDVGKAIAAGAAIGAFPFELHRLERVGARSATTRASDAIRPTARDQIRIAGILIRERCFELSDGHLRNLLGLLFAGHDDFPLDLESKSCLA